jgi:hypothetical protein
LALHGRMLTSKDKKLITDINTGANASSEELRQRYPTKVIHAFKGKIAFDLHAQMVHLDEEWLEACSDIQRKKSLLFIVKQFTISKATLKNPDKAPSKQIQRIFSILYTPCSETPVRSKLMGKKWIKMVDDLKEHDLL